MKNRSSKLAHQNTALTGTGNDSKRKKTKQLVEQPSEALVTSTEASLDTAPSSAVNESPRDGAEPLPEAATHLVADTPELPPADAIVTPSPEDLNKTPKPATASRLGWKSYTALMLGTAATALLETRTRQSEKEEADLSTTLLRDGIFFMAITIATATLMTVAHGAYSVSRWALWGSPKQKDTPPLPAIQKQEEETSDLNEEQEKAIQTLSTGDLVAGSIGGLVPTSVLAELSLAVSLASSPLGSPRLEVPVVSPALTAADLVPLLSQLEALDTRVNGLAQGLQQLEQTKTVSAPNAAQAQLLAEACTQFKSFLEHAQGLLHQMDPQTLKGEHSIADHAETSSSPMLLDRRRGDRASVVDKNRWEPQNVSHQPIHSEPAVEELSPPTHMVPTDHQHADKARDTSPSYHSLFSKSKN